MVRGGQQMPKGHELARLHFYPFFLSLSSFLFILFDDKLTQFQCLFFTFFVFLIQNTHHVEWDTNHRTLQCMHCKYVGIWVKYILSPHGDPIVSVCSLLAYGSLDEKECFLVLGERKETSIGNMQSCNLCVYKTKILKDLRMHVKAIHIGLKDLRCNICSFETHSATSLRQHTKSVHENIKDMVCDKCLYKTNKPCRKPTATQEVYSCENQGQKNMTNIHISQVGQLVLSSTRSLCMKR